MTDFNFSIDIDFKCEECGRDLDGEVEERPHGSKRFSIEPCPECIQKVFDEGYDNGLQESRDSE